METIDNGKIGICYLKTIWDYYHQLRIDPIGPAKLEWKYVNGVFNALGIASEPTINYLMQNNHSFNQFENWIEDNGRISQETINQFNLIFKGKNINRLPSDEDVFSSAEIEEWHKNGYIILRNAITKRDCERTVNLIYDKIDANSHDSKTWYKNHPLKQGIMIQLFKSSILDSNRFSKRIRLAYEQLWNRRDLLVSMDRVSFNPPENNYYKFPGPDLHWDMSLKRPIPFGLQGLLYLSDTDENQGAFTVIPGFHNTIEEWLSHLGENENPRDDKHLSNFKKKCIKAKAGDFIIWNQCLPHGSSPNTSDRPRIVQYINYQPIDLEYQAEWI